MIFRQTVTNNGEKVCFELIRSIQLIHDIRIIHFILFCNHWSQGPKTKHCRKNDLFEIGLLSKLWRVINQECVYYTVILIPPCFYHFSSWVEIHCMFTIHHNTCNTVSNNAFSWKLTRRENCVNILTVLSYPAIKINPYQILFNQRRTRRNYLGSNFFL